MRDSQYLRFVRIAALIAIGAGVVARVLDFGSTPLGLNRDEASIGYDAWCLLHYGIDRAGMSWPVQRIDYGYGGHASYAYIAMPFVGFGLSPFTIRLPMLISALMSLPLIWIVARKLFDENAAWSATAVVALSPWHIMLSRWALEGNILPFLFLCGLTLFVLMIDATRKLRWLIAACTMFGVSVYSYGAAYLAVPLFVLSSLAVCLSARIITMRQAALGALIFAITTTPIALYVLVNFFRWGTIKLGGITIPLLPGEAGYKTQIAEGPLAHVGQFLRLMATQQDGTVYNVTDPYGVLYSGIFFALAFGLAIAAPMLVANRQWPSKRLFISLWVIACIPTGIVQEPNINRVNLLLMGLVVAAGLALATIDKWVRGVLILGLVSLSILFGFFVHAYFTAQNDRIAIEFFDGLVPALEYAQDSTAEDAKICVSGEIVMPQVYTLFTEARDPREYARSVQYIDPTAPIGPVASYGRYTFGLERCNFAEAQAVVARQSERVLEPFVRVKSFGLFDVYAAPSAGKPLQPPSA
jgi:hypothetical protein